MSYDRGWGKTAPFDVIPLGHLGRQAAAAGNSVVWEQWTASRWVWRGTGEPHNGGHSGDAVEPANLVAGVRKIGTVVTPGKETHTPC